MGAAVIDFPEPAVTCQSCRLSVAPADTMECSECGKLTCCTCVLEAEWLAGACVSCFGKKVGRLEQELEATRQHATALLKVAVGGLEAVDKLDQAMIQANPYHAANKARKQAREALMKLRAMAEA